MTQNELRRFNEKWVPEPNTGCWLWTASDNGAGYGWLSHDGRYGGRSLAHRLAYEHWREPIRHGKVIDHLCRVRPCVNPWHLRVVTQRENVMAPGSLSSSKERSQRVACLRGHARFQLRKDRTRYCLECHRLLEINRRWKRKRDADVVLNER